MIEEDFNAFVPAEVELDIDCDLIDEWIASSRRLLWSDSVRGKYPGVIKDKASARKYLGNPLELRLIERFGNLQWRVDGPVITCHIAGGKGLAYTTYKLYYAHNAAGELQRYEETLDDLEYDKNCGCDLWSFDLVMERVGWKELK